MCLSVHDLVRKGQERDVEQKSVYQKIPQTRFLGYNIGICCIPSQKAKNSDLSGIWRDVFLHVGMKIRVSTWSFLSVTIPFQNPIPVGKENSDSTRKFVRNYLNWRTKYLNTSTTIRKILVPKKLLSNICKYIKSKPISHQNQKLTQQHNWKKSSSSPREASVFVPLSVILSVNKG